MKRERSGQYTLSLKRDLIADFYDETMDATAFVSRGYVDFNNPLIFNPEGITVNQIKKHEILLKDSTLSSWIVGYVAADLGKTEDPDTGTPVYEDVSVAINYEQEIIPDISTFEYADLIGQKITGQIKRHSKF